MIINGQSVDADGLGPTADRPPTVLSLNHSLCPSYEWNPHAPLHPPSSNCPIPEPGAPYFVRRRSWMCWCRTGEVQPALHGVYCP